MAILADFFNAIRRYRKEQGGLLLYYLQNFIPDGRLIRVSENGAQQFIPLLRSKMAEEYDVIVDETPSSPNMKERTWSILMQMTPILSKLPVPPQVWMELLKFSPLPETLTSKIEQLMQQAQQQPKNQNPVEASRAAYHQAQAQKLGAEADRTKVETQMLVSGQGSEVSERQARIENLRAQAFKALTDSGVAQDDQRFKMVVQAIDHLQSSIQASHDQAMDLIGAHQGAIGLDQGQQQIDQPQPQPMQGAT
jgi:hypothetical protein